MCSASRGTLLICVSELLVGRTDGQSVDGGGERRRDAEEGRMAEMHSESPGNGGNLH